MTRTSSVAILGAVIIATAAIAEGARAHSRLPAAETSDSHTAASHQGSTLRGPGESHVDPPFVADPGSAPRPVMQQGDSIDWGNPHDLMLHGVPIGKTRDMR